MTRDSYTHGASPVPLIGETLGAHFDRMARAYAGNDAVVSCQQGVRLTYEQLRAATDDVARGLLALGVAHGDRVGIWSTNNVEWVIAQFATPKIGAILVNVNPAYRTAEVSYALAQSGVSVLLTQVRHKTSEYAEMLREVRPALPDLRTIVLIGDDELEAPLEGSTTDQHPVHVGHDGLPQGRHALAPQHPQQRLLRRRGLPLHRARSRLHPGAVLPLLRDGAGQPRLRHARRDDGHSGEAFDPRAVARGRRRRALHVALRRAHDVHRGARAAGLRVVRSVDAAHRDHGGLAVPRSR
jgi:hypothetical protein